MPSAWIIAEAPYRSDLSMPLNPAQAIYVAKAPLKLTIVVAEPLAAPTVSAKVRCIPPVNPALFVIDPKLEVVPANMFCAASILNPSVKTFDVFVV